MARWFFRVGGAAGTIAKTMSAYDMTFSDAVYGPSERYVSRQRLQHMLDYEYRLLLERLESKRGAQTRFFAFADTVAARSYSRQDEAHGWMGIKFQPRPADPPSRIILHLRMLDRENVQQQEALGLLGVNLLYGALYLSHEPETLLASLLDDLTRERVEVDLMQFDGPAFQTVDNRQTSLQLVQQGLTESALFTASREVVQPSDVFYKKPILVVRGSFRPITAATLDLLRCAQTQFALQPQVPDKEIVVLTEMTLRHLAEGGVIDYQDFLARADTLGALGLTVLVSSYARYFRLAAYLLRHTAEPVGIAMGVRRLRELFDEKYYADLDGGILEALGRMFRHGLKLYIYPVVEQPGQPPLTAQNLEVAPHLTHLYQFLLQNRHIEDIHNYQPAYLQIFAQDVLAQIREGNPAWKQLVPPPVARIIEQRRLFGCP